MAFKDLPTSTMANLFSPWINDPTQKALFVSIPELAGIHGHVERAYRAVLVTLPSTTSTPPELTAIYDQENLADARHDHLARAMALTIDSQKEFYLGLAPPDLSGADACDAASAKLFPDGLLCITASFRAESGNSERISSLLDQDATLAAFLKSALLKKGTTLLDAVKLWLAAGAELGVLEDKKDALLRAQGAVVVPTKADVQQARNLWIRTANRIVDILDDTQAAAEDIEAIRGRLVDAAAKAGKRAAASVTPEPSPANPPPTAT